MKIHLAFVDYIGKLQTRHGWKHLENELGVSKQKLSNWRSALRTKTETNVNEANLLDILRKLRRMDPIQAFDPAWFPAETWEDLKRRSIHPGVSTSQVRRVPELTLEAVAEWERTFQHLSQFWVILPRSLVYDASYFFDVMLHNLRRGVCYLYIVVDKQDRIEQVGDLARELIERDKTVRDIVESRVRYLALKADVAVDFFTATHVLIANPQRIPAGVEVEYVSGLVNGGSPLSEEKAREYVRMIQATETWSKENPLPGNAACPREPRADAEEKDQLASLVADVENRRLISKRSPAPNGKRYRFNEPGGVHVHIDVAAHPELLAILSPLVGRDAWKIATVHGAVHGPQASDPSFASAYRVHDPASGGRLDYLLTSAVPVGRDLLEEEMRSAVCQRVCALLSACQNTANVVVEAERVIERYDNGKATRPRSGIERLARLEERDVGMKPESTPPFELHHSISVNRRDAEESPPISLEELSLAMEKAGIVFGGLFVFADDGLWQFRSNAFFTGAVNGLVAKEHDKLRRLASELMRTGSNGFRQLDCKSVFEEILGIWRPGATNETGATVQ